MRAAQGRDIRPYLEPLHSVSKDCVEMYRTVGAYHLFVNRDAKPNTDWDMVYAESRMKDAEEYDEIHKKEQPVDPRILYIQQEVEKAQLSDNPEFMSALKQMMTDDWDAYNNKN